MQTYRCTRALEDGTRCTTEVPKGWATCKLHRRWSLGFSLTDTHKKVLFHLWEGDWYYADAPLSERRKRRALTTLERRRLVVKDDSGEYSITEWGRDIVGNSRYFDGWPHYFNTQERTQ